MLGTFQRGDIVFGDAFYGTYFLLAHLKTHGIDGLFKQMGVRRPKTDFHTGQQLGSKDHIILLKKPNIKPDWMLQVDYESSPEELAIREIGCKGKILITTLLCPKKISKLITQCVVGQRLDVLSPGRSNEGRKLILYY